MPREQITKSAICEIEAKVEGVFIAIIVVATVNSNNPKSKVRTRGSFRWMKATNKMKTNAIIG